MNTHKKLPAILDATTTLPAFSDGITSITSGNGFVSVPNSVISFSGSNSWSMEIWVYADILMDNATLLSCAGEFSLSAIGSTITFSLNGQPFALTAQETFQAQTWTHVAVTCDSNTIFLYVDGIPQTQSNMAGTGPASTGNPIQAGGGFYGQLDSFRLWSVVVSANNIGDYQFVDYPSATTGLQAQIDLTQNPPADTSGNNVPVTLSATGAQYVSFIPSVCLQGTAFVDTYADQQVNPAGSATDFSIMAWVYPTLMGTEMSVFANGTNESPAGMTLMINAAGNVEFQVGQSPMLVSNFVLTAGSWFNVAVTWSAALTTGTIYINGEFDSTSASMTLAGASQPNGEPILGAVVSTQSAMPVSTFNGYMQLVSVWNCALSASAIQSNLTTDPLLQGVTPGGTAQGCIADYNLAMLPAQNSISGNPLGLVGGAALSTQGVLAGINLGSSVRGPLAGDLERFSKKMSGAFPDHWLEEGAFDVMLDDMISALKEHKISPEQEKAFTAVLQENLQRAFDDMKSGNYKSFTGDVVYTSEMLEDAREISEKTGIAITCVQCVIGILTTTFNLVLAVFAIPVDQTTLGGLLLKYLKNLPWVASLLASVQSMMPGPNPNPSQLFTYIKDMVMYLYENQVLTPILTMAYEAVTTGITWWTKITLMARIGIIFAGATSGAATAWAFVQLAYSIAQLGIAINACSGCTSSSQQQVRPAYA